MDHYFKLRTSLLHPLSSPLLGFNITKPSYHVLFYTKKQQTKQYQHQQSTLTTEHELLDFVVCRGKVSKKEMHLAMKTSATD